MRMEPHVHGRQTPTHAVFHDAVRPGQRQNEATVRSPKMVQVDIIIRAARPRRRFRQPVACAIFIQNHLDVGAVQNQSRVPGAPPRRASAGAVSNVAATVRSACRSSVAAPCVTSKDPSTCRFSHHGTRTSVRWLERQRAASLPPPCQAVT